MYYLFISENKIEKYNGDILKRYVGNRMVKAISNPTDEDLKEFGYMTLIEDDIPAYDEETQYLDCSYELDNDTIRKVWIVKENNNITGERGDEV